MMAAFIVTSAHAEPKIWLQHGSKPSEKHGDIDLTLNCGVVTGIQITAKNVCEIIINNPDYDRANCWKCQTRTKQVQFTVNASNSANLRQADISATYIYDDFQNEFGSNRKMNFPAAGPASQITIKHWGSFFPDHVTVRMPKCTGPVAQVSTTISVGALVPRLTAL